MIKCKFHYFQRELQLVRKLEHKNLVKVLDIEEEEDPNVCRQIVIMELCEGRSLYSFLSMPVNRYGLQDKEFLIVLNDVTEGVRYLRENNVVHRDIKPGKHTLFNVNHILLVNFFNSNNNNNKNNDFASEQQLTQIFD